MKYIVYLIKSKNKRWYYVGMTTSMDRRLQQHNSGLVKSTKHYRPFMVIYVKRFCDREIARDFEKYLKIRCNKEKLLRTLKEL